MRKTLLCAGNMKIELEKEQLQALLPFHMVISTDGKIVKLSHSLAKAIQIPDTHVDITQVFTSIYPSPELNAENVINRAAPLLLVAKQSGLRLKMQPVVLNNEHILLAGNPIIDTGFDPARFHLSITDFAQHDNIAEHLFLMQATKKSLEDSAKVNIELEESKEQYRKVVDNVHDIIFQTDGEGKWTFLNKAWEDVMGFTLEESIGELFFNYLHPDDVQKNQELFAPLINQEKSYCTHEIRYVAKNGAVKWIVVYAILTFDKDGNITGTAGTLRDITAEKENSQKYELLANNINDMVCIIDMTGKFIYVSPSIKTVAGYLPEEFIGKQAIQFAHPEDIRSFIELRNASTDGNDLRLVRHRILTEKGEWLWMESSVRQTYDANNTPLGVVTCSRIIEDRIRAEQATITALKHEQEVSQIKSKFISIVSHEMKTPMTSIYTGVEIMEKYAEKHNIAIDTFNRQFNIIKTETDRLNDLIENILFWGKVENGKINSKIEPVHLESFLQQVCDKYNRLSTDGRTVSLTIKGEPYALDIDPLHLENIAGNLIGNAFKYSAGKQAPEVHLTFSDTECVLKFKDYGIGIPKSELPHLFTSFFRASNVSFIKGNGLGMGIVKHFADLYHAKLRVNSKINEGTEVTVRFPKTLIVPEVKPQLAILEA